MTVLSAQSIDGLIEHQHLGIDPYVPISKTYNGMSYGLTAAGYDIRLSKFKRGSHESIPFEEGIVHMPPGAFWLASSFERMRIPDDLQVIVHDKSTLARQGLAIQNTVLEPGWEGWITLELSNHSNRPIKIMTGMPIAQLVFHKLDMATFMPYKGKYQNQADEPVHPIILPDTPSNQQPEGDQ